MELILIGCAIVAVGILMRLEMRVAKFLEFPVQVTVRPSSDLQSAGYGLLTLLIDHYNLVNKDLQQQAEMRDKKPDLGDDLEDPTNIQREDLRRMLSEHREAGVIPDYLYENLMDKFGLNEEETTNV